MNNLRKIQTSTELHEWFFATKNNTRQTSIMVGSDVRRETLLGETQGTIILEGTVMRIKFEDKQDGVWLASIVRLNEGLTG